MEHIVFWIIVGLIAGALAKMVVPGEGPSGVIGDIVMGLIGAVIGGWLFSVLLGQQGRREIVSDDFTRPRPTPTPAPRIVPGIIRQPTPSGAWMWNATHRGVLDSPTPSPTGRP